MKKAWLVFKYEYLRHVLRKRFLLGLLSVPLIIAFSIGVGFLSVLVTMDVRPVGYVDQAGVIRELPSQSSPTAPNLKAFADEAAARSALDAKEIQAYAVIPPNYAETRIVRLVAIDSSMMDDPASEVRKAVRYNLLLDEEPTVAKRVQSGPQLEIRSTEDDRRANEKNILGMILPIVAAILLLVVVNTSGGYLMQAVVEEKENRTMEIVVTSVSPEQLMIGKTFGNLSVGLTQLAVWLGMGLLGVLVAMRFLPFAQDLSLSSSYFWLTLLTFVPAFVMIAALMAMVGATVTETREAQQVSGMFSLPLFVPLWFITPLLQDPNGTLAIIFTFIPFTAPLTLPLRAAYSTVPLWQSALSIGLLFAAAIGAMWLSARVFRMGMLRYGKRLSLKEIFKRP